METPPNATPQPFRQPVSGVFAAQFNTFSLKQMHSGLTLVSSGAQILSHKPHCLHTWPSVYNIPIKLLLFWDVTPVERKQTHFIAGS